MKQLFSMLHTASTWVAVVGILLVAIFAIVEAIVPDLVYAQDLLLRAQGAITYLAFGGTAMSIVLGLYRHSEKK